MSRCRTAVLAVMCVVVLALGLAVPEVLDATQVDAQTTTTTTTYTVPTTTTTVLPNRCTPEAPCSYLGDSYKTGDGGVFGFSTTQTFDDLPDNVPPNWAFSPGTWAYRPQWLEMGDEFFNNSGFEWTTTHVRVWSTTTETNNIKVFSIHFNENWPAPGTPTPLPSQQLQPAATAVCPGIGQYDLPRYVDCPLSAPVLSDVNGRLIISADTHLLRSIGGKSSMALSKVPLDVDQTGWRPEAVRTWDSDEHWLRKGSASYNFGTGPIGYYGRFREPNTPPVTTVPPPPPDDPRDLDNIREPTEENLASFCTFAWWDWESPAGPKGGRDPLLIEDWEFWNDAMCYFDALLFAAQGHWETTYDIGRQLLDLQVFGINAQQVSAMFLGDIFVGAIDGLGGVLDGLLGEGSPIMSGLALILGGLSAGGPLGQVISGGSADIVAAVQGLDFTVEMPDSSDPFWGPLFDLISSLVSSFTTMIADILSTLVDEFDQLVTAIGSLLQSLMVPSPSKVQDLADEVQDVDVLEEAGELATLPGDVVLAAQSSPASCTAPTIEVRTGAAFSLCDSMTATMSNPAWGTVRMMVLGGLGFLVLVTLYRRITHHMEN